MNTHLSIIFTAMAYSPTYLGGWLRAEMAWPVSYIHYDTYAWIMEIGG